MSTVKGGLKWLILTIAHVVASKKGPQAIEILNLGVPAHPALNPKP